MDALSMAAYGISMAGMVEAMVLHGRNPAVSIELMWLSSVVSTMAITNQFLNSGHRRRRWEPQLLPE